MTEFEQAVKAALVPHVAFAVRPRDADAILDVLAPRVAAAIAAAYEAGNGYPAGAPEIELAVAVRALGARGSEKPQ